MSMLIIGAFIGTFAGGIVGLWAGAFIHEAAYRGYQANDVNPDQLELDLGNR